MSNQPDYLTKIRTLKDERDEANRSRDLNAAVATLALDQRDALAGELAALKASNEATLAALRRVLADVRSTTPGRCLAAFSLSDYDCAVRALLDAATATATKDSCASSLTSDAQPPSLSAVSSEPK